MSLGTRLPTFLTSSALQGPIFDLENLNAYVHSQLIVGDDLEHQTVRCISSSGKVVWATATLPYVVLTILLIRGLMLPGAIGGIVYYLKPEMDRLSDTQVTSYFCSCGTSQHLTATTVLPI
jgi:hypothetical protein